MSKVCKNCGAPISNDDVCCPYCGQNLPVEYNPREEEEYDDNSWNEENSWNHETQPEEEQGQEYTLDTWKIILSFLIPILGFVLFFKMREQCSRAATVILIVTIIGTVCWFLVATGGHPSIFLFVGALIYYFCRK